jgi:hypothetical protein
MAVCSRAADELRLTPDARHRAAVASGLGWADDAAARGDYTEALSWLRTIEAVGDQLTPECQAKRDACLTLAGGRPPAARSSRAA